MRLTFDTETTGIANFKLPPNHPSQPRVIQLGAILKDDHNHVVAELNLLVKPVGFTIPDEAAAIHRITTEQALKYGLKIETVIKLFMQLVRMADLLVGFNIAYDDLLVKNELMRAGFTEDLAVYAGKRQYCAMQAATEVCKIPGRFGKYKWPKLQEAHKHLFGVEFEAAHDAMADVRATDRVYVALQPAAAPSTPLTTATPT